MPAPLKTPTLNEIVDELFDEFYVAMASLRLPREIWFADLKVVIRNGECVNVQFAKDVRPKGLREGPRVTDPPRR